MAGKEIIYSIQVVGLGKLGETNKIVIQSTKDLSAAINRVKKDIKTLQELDGVNVDVLKKTLQQQKSLLEDYKLRISDTRKEYKLLRDSATKDLKEIEAALNKAISLQESGRQRTGQIRSALRSKRKEQDAFNQSGKGEDQTAYIQKLDALYVSLTKRQMLLDQNVQKLGASYKKFSESSEKDILKVKSSLDNLVLAEEDLKKSIKENEGVMSKFNSVAETDSNRLKQTLLDLESVKARSTEADKKAASVLKAMGETSIDATEKLTAKIALLTREYSNLVASGKQGEAQSQKVLRELNKLKATKESITKNIKEDAILQKATGDITVSAYQRLNAQLVIARNKYKDIAAQFGVGSKEAKQYLADVRKLDNQLKDIDSNAGQNQRSVGNYRKALGGLGTTVAQVFGIGTGIAAAAAVVGRLSRALSEAKTKVIEFDEKVADLSKVTNTTMETSRELAYAIASIDTRTSVQSLLDLAVAGGRLGLAQEDIKGFVTEADKLFIALGDTIEGDAEEVALIVGKMAENFGLIERYGIADALNKVGSVMNALGASSAAQEPRIIDFTNRLAGIAPVAEFTIAQVAALGATFDAGGQSMEIAATSMQRLLPELATRAGRFSKIVKMQEEDFKNLLRNDAFGALRLVLEASRSAEGGLLGLASTLGMVDAEAARSAQIWSFLINNMDNLERNLITANAQMLENTSINQEAAKKQDTLTAAVENTNRAYEAMILSMDKGDGAFSNLFRNFEEMKSQLFSVIKLLNDGEISWSNFLTSWSVKDMVNAVEEADKQVGFLTTRYKTLAEFRRKEEKERELLAGKNLSSGDIDKVIDRSASIIRENEVISNLNKNIKETIKNNDDFKRVFEVNTKPIVEIKKSLDGGFGDVYNEEKLRDASAEYKKFFNTLQGELGYTKEKIDEMWASLRSDTSKSLEKEIFGDDPVAKAEKFFDSLNFDSTSITYLKDSLELAKQAIKDLKFDTKGAEGQIYNKAQQYLKERINEIKGNIKDAHAVFRDFIDSINTQFDTQVLDIRATINPGDDGLEQQRLIQEKELERVNALREAYAGRKGVQKELNDLKSKELDIANAIHKIDNAIVERDINRVSQEREAQALAELNVVEGTGSSDEILEARRKFASQLLDIEFDAAEQRLAMLNVNEDEYRILVEKKEAIVAKIKEEALRQSIERLSDIEKDRIAEAKQVLLEAQKTGDEDQIERAELVLQNRITNIQKTALALRLQNKVYSAEEEKQLQDELNEYILESIRNSNSLTEFENRKREEFLDGIYDLKKYEIGEKRITVLREKKGKERLKILKKLDEEELKSAVTVAEAKFRLAVLSGDTKGAEKALAELQAAKIALEGFLKGDGEDGKKFDPEKLKGVAFDAASRVMSELFAREEAEVDRMLQKRLAAVEEEYQAKIAAAVDNAQLQKNLEGQLAKEKEELERQAAKDKQKIRIKEAIAETALSIIRASPNLFAMGLAALTGAAQILAIKAQKFEKGGRIRSDGTVEGPSHSNGGVQAVINGNPVEVEGGERSIVHSDGTVDIVNKRSARRFKRELDYISTHEFPNKKLAVSRINSYNRNGISFMENGGRIAPSPQGIIQRMTEQSIVIKYDLADSISGMSEKMAKEVSSGVSKAIKSQNIGGNIREGARQGLVEANRRTMSEYQLRKSEII